MKSDILDALWQERNDLRERVEELEGHEQSFNNLMVLVADMVEPGAFKSREDLLQNFDV